jgi:hypothetical protein
VSADDPGPARRLAGRWLATLGVALFPLGGGAAIGFWAADLGMRWMPTMLGLLAATAVCSMLALIGGRLLAGDAFVTTPAGTRVRRRLFAMLGGIVVAIGVRFFVGWMDTPTALTGLSPEEFDATFAADLADYREHDAALERLLRRMAATRALDGGPAVPDADEELELLDLWRAFHDHAFALDQVRIFHEDWWRFDPSRAERDRHLRSFLLTYCAELALYEKGRRAVDLVERNPDVVKLLDAPHPELGLDADTFGRLRQELSGTRDLARVIAGRDYLEWLETGLDGAARSRALGVGSLWDRVELHLDRIDAIAPLDTAAATIGSDLEVLRRSVRRAWYPTQKEVAEWLGDTRVRRRGWYLVTREQQEEMDLALEPGDVMLARKNWYLSNIGLPGFWPHAILYVGDPDKLAAYFDGDPEVAAWLRTRTGDDRTFSQHLARALPGSWIDYRAGERGDPFRVIEAVSEGVVLNTLDHAAGDYVAVLRPRLSRAVKARAVLHAFEQLGKPYDFDFDFATDHALVCTELVWRAYRPVDGGPGLDLPLVRVAGRHTLPANEIARVYADEHGTPAARFDFVWFLDAREAQGRAVLADEAAFRDSHRRLKWDVAQE